MRLTIAAAFLGVMVAAAGAQQPAPRSVAPDFSAETRFVQLPVRVLDSRGRFVRQLTASHFRILEDGTPQSIVSFRAVDIPFIAQGRVLPETSRESLEPGALDELSPADGRLYLFVLDDLHLQSDYTLKLQNLLRAFILDKMSANDAGAIVLTSGAQKQDWTQNRRLLIDAVGWVSGQYDPEIDRRFLPMTRNRVLRLVTDISRQLGAIEDRHKALVLVTPDPLCPGDEIQENTQDCGTVLDAAVRSDVSIYTIDPRGLVTGERSRAEHKNPNSRLVNGAWIGASNGQAARAAFGAARAEFRGPLDGARYLAEQSGGFAVVNTNNLLGGLDRMVRENSSYYLIGYYSTNTNVDRKLRRHDVKVKGRGLRALHRAGYFAVAPASGR